MKTSPDLLQALLDRRKAEKGEQAQPASEAKAPDAESKPLPVVEVTPRPAASAQAIGVPSAKPASSLGIPPRGMMLTFPMFVTALVIAAAGLIGSFFLGRLSVQFVSDAGTSETPSSPAKPNVTSAPSMSPFEWGKKFTVEATRSGLSKAEADRLGEYCKYLAKHGVTASAFELEESGAKVGVIFLGGADSANDKSLVKLRDWLREIPGPDGTGRPFQAAKIRETPKQKK